jgi:hypothetical protein
MFVNPGKIRNNALALVTSDFVYTSDADIMFLHPNYLDFLVKRLTDHPKLALEKPPMKRLPVQHFERFLSRIHKDGVGLAMSSLVRANEYILTTCEEEIPLKVTVGRNGRTYTTGMSEFLQYKSDPSLRGWEPKIWFEVVHCGGIFARMTDLEAVGGYAECYETWGFEDADLQWKLGSMFYMERVPNGTGFEVLHLDHPKGYFSKTKNEQNMIAFQRRQDAGILAAIQEDRIHVSSLGWRRRLYGVTQIEH